MPRLLSPAKACGLVTSWMKCLSIYNTDGPSAIVLTICASYIFSKSVFDIVVFSIVSFNDQVTCLRSHDASLVGLCHRAQVGVFDFFFLICEFEKFNIEHIDIIAIELVPQFLETVC